MKAGRPVIASIGQIMIMIMMMMMMMMMVVMVMMMISRRQLGMFVGQIPDLLEINHIKLRTP